VAGRHQGRYKFVTSCVGPSIVSPNLLDLDR
jgi:hypothetical protein